MAHNLLTALSTIRSNILRCTRFSSNVRCFQTIKLPQHKLRNNNLTSQSKFRHTPINIPVRHVSSESYHRINTNIVNNVILWKFEDEKYFRNMKIFTVAQSIVLSSVSYMMSLYLSNLDKYETYKEFIVDNSIILVTVVMPLMAAVFASILVWFFMTRSLKYIILNKGGKMVTLVSYHPLKESSQTVAPVQDVIVAKGRQDVGQYTSVKVKNTKFFFLIDKSGIHVNPQLFDITIGSKSSIQ